MVIALIVYGSLYPWDFHSTQLAASPLWVLIHSWPDHIDRFLFRDIAVNVAIYLPVGVFGLLALRQKFQTPFAVIVTVLVALALSSSIEMTQLFDDARDCSAFDVVCNVTGTVLGVALGYIYQQWLKRFLARTETTKLLHPSGAVLLFYTWLAYPRISSLPGTQPHQVGRQISSPLRGRVDLSAGDIQLFRRVVGRGTTARKCAWRGAHPPIVPAVAVGVAGQAPSSRSDRHLVRNRRCSARMHLLVLPNRISKAHGGCGRPDGVAADPAWARSVSLEP